MENRTRKNRRALQRKARARKILLTASLLLVVIAASVSGTIAWLTASTTPVTNTFTYGDINIGLAETNNTYKIVPGVKIAKDPKVTVNANSEACWLFVKVEEENWPTFTETDGTTKKVSYAIADGWTALEGETGVYYREVGAVTADTDYYVLKDNQVTVSENLTKDEVNSVTGQQPKLTFTAYAVQKDGIADAAAAWKKTNN